MAEQHDPDLDPDVALATRCWSERPWTMLLVGIAFGFAAGVLVGIVVVWAVLELNSV